MPNSFLFKGKIEAVDININSRNDNQAKNFFTIEIEKGNSHQELYRMNCGIGDQKVTSEALRN